MKGSGEILALVISLGIAAVTILIAVFAMQALDEHNRSQALVNGEDLGGITDISTGEEYCVVETGTGSKYSIDRITRCEDLETGMRVYRAPEKIQGMPFGKKLYVYSNDEIQEMKGGMQ